MPAAYSRPVFKQLIKLAWPVVLAFMMQTSYNLVDIFWVGKLGATAIASVSLAGNFFYIILALGQVIGSGTVALVAHSFGARSIDRANSIAKQSLLLAFILSIVIGTLAFAYSKQIMYFLGGRDTVLTLSTGYLRIVSIGFFFQLLSFSINYIFRGAGDMKIPMYIMLIATIINLMLDPLLILGIGFFPRLEVQGAAVATAIAKFVSFVVGFLILTKGRSGIKMNFHTTWKLEGAIVRKIFGVGIPVGISYGLMATSIMVVFGIVAAFSEHALAALGIGSRIFQFASLPVVGIGIATTTIVGQNLGARDARGAMQTGNTALGLSCVIMIAFIMLFMANARGLIALFTQSVPTIEHGIEFIRIVSFYLIFVGITTSLTGVFRGAGYTIPPMIAGILKVSLLYILASSLSRTMHAGVTGVWWAMLIAYGLESLVMVLWYRKGTWRAKGLALLKGLAPARRTLSE
ncbi:MAG: MATE family efflux transporter [candidate division WOR-3 bacterium]|nr:MAG: MATE family efflux transporter [candidate division WOR-3 bacterium]